MSGRNMAGARLACVAAAAWLVAAWPLTAPAQSGMGRAEAAQLYAAAGFAIANDRPTNRCAQPARPNVTFVDINADKRPEALFVDVDAKCYAPSGRYFAVLVKTGSGWRPVISGTGAVQSMATRTAGWLDMRVTDGACARDFRYDGRSYVAASACAGQAVTAAPRTRAPAPAAAPPPAAPQPRTAAAAATLQPADEAAAFKAAGFTKRGAAWRSGCDDPGTASYSPGRVERVMDLNGDGLPEVVLSEGGTYCYGHTGQAFWVLSRQADGRWKLITQSTGIPEFLKTTGAQGWPDISVGGPGFCFAVERWNGREYKQQRWEYEGKACKPAR